MTTLDFGNAPVAKRSKIQATLPAPPEYSVCSPDTPALYGRELKQYIETIASVCTSPIQFEEYLGKRLSTEHVVWYSTLLSARMDSEERYPVDFDKLWPMLYSRKDPAIRALCRDHRDILEYINLHSNVEEDSRRGPEVHFSPFKLPHILYHCTIQANNGRPIIQRFFHCSCRATSNERK